ncbi:Uncharacterised protein [Streptococcus criceti]|nr:Uncharacterised protein [Streptococcus criceti]
MDSYSILTAVLSILGLIYEFYAYLRSRQRLGRLS